MTSEVEGGSGLRPVHNTLHSLYRGRATERIVADLAEAGYIKTARSDRRSRSTVGREHAIRHSSQNGCEIGALLEALSVS